MSIDLHVFELDQKILMFDLTVALDKTSVDYRIHHNSF